MKQTKFTRFKRIIFLILFVVFLSIGLYGWNFCNVHTLKSVEKIESNEIVEDSVDYIQQQKDSIEQLLILEVQNYINTKTTKCHNLVPKYLVHAALNHDIDLCFMMAQTQIETCYGTTGAGRESSRKSLFGVAIKRYTDYENAIDDYCKLLKKSYLGKGRTEQHLLIKYVTHRGGRYAENPKYESELKNAYQSIKKSTSIYSLQQQMKNIF